LEAVPAVPSYSYALTGLPQRDIGADGIDASGNFMAWHARILNSRPLSFLDERVTVADTAGFHLDAHLPAPGLRHRALDDLEITSWLADLNGFHANSFLCGVYQGCDGKSCEGFLVSVSVKSSLCFE
jgi:hypothetical protein